MIVFDVRLLRNIINLYKKKFKNQLLDEFKTG